MSSLTVNENPTVQQALQRALALRGNEATQASPYRNELEKERDTFVEALQKEDVSNLQRMHDSARSKAARGTLGRVMTYAGWAGMAATPLLMWAGIVPQTANVYAGMAIAVLGGIASKGSEISSQARQQRRLLCNLDEWRKHLGPSTFDAMTRYDLVKRAQEAVSRTEPSPYVTRVREENEAYIRRAQKDQDLTMAEVEKRDDLNEKRNDRIFKGALFAVGAPMIGGLLWSGFDIAHAMVGGASWSVASHATNPAAGAVLFTGLAAYAGAAAYYRLRVKPEMRYAGHNRDWRYELRWGDYHRRDAARKAEHA